MATSVGGCFFQTTARVSSTNSKSNLAHHPNLINNPFFLSPRLSTRLSLPFRPHRCSATAELTLPTAKPGRAISDDKIRWSARALKSFALAELQAIHFKRDELGTESILLGILVDATSEATKYLRKIGVTLSNVREETYKFIDWDWRYDPPEEFSVSDSAQRALDWAVDYKIKSGTHFALPCYMCFIFSVSDSAQRALDWAVDYKIKSGGDGEITVGHLVLGIWSEKESTGHEVLAALGFDSEKAKELSEIAAYDAPLNFRF